MKMENEKFYLDESLTLQKLSNILNVTPHIISQIINEHTNQNYFNFVNKFRVEEAKKKLGDIKFNHLNISEIAFNVGFNSLSAFNTSFKKQTNKTPTEYRRLS